MLELYQSEECPACGRVRGRLCELGVSYVVHNPRMPRTQEYEPCNDLTYDHLRELAGEDRIPFLVDTARRETALGPDDIVA